LLKGDGITDPWLDKDMQPLALSESEIDDVVAFLASLTSPQYKEVGDQEYARQLATSKVNRPQRDTERAFGPKPKRHRLLRSDCSLKLPEPWRRKDCRYGIWSRCPSCRPDAFARGCFCFAEAKIAPQRYRRDYRLQHPRIWETERLKFCN
jgi:hypothetical protein